MTAIKHHLEGRPMDAPAHVYTVFIRATPDRVWRAITDGAETEQYYFATRVESDWAVGSPITYLYPDGRVAADGEILEIDPPKRLHMTFHARWDPRAADLAPIRHLWEVAAEDDGTTRLTVTTFDLDASSDFGTQFRDGIVYIVSGLKTWLETREPMVAG
jgi:uncharacterized protein YndB with AHSA1/START domain